VKPLLESLLGFIVGSAKQVTVLAQPDCNMLEEVADLIRLIGVPAVIVHPRSHTLSQLVSSEARWTQGK
jgi:hypothetical protein